MHQRSLPANLEIKLGSDDDEQRYWSCGRKRKYTSWAGAKKAARRAGMMFERVFRVYRCRQFCGFLHLASDAGVEYREEVEERAMPPPDAAQERREREGCLIIVRMVEARRRLKMSIEMVPVKSSNVRAVGLDVPDKSSEHLIASRILVQFDSGVYECAYKGYGGSTGESRRAYVKAVYERFLVAESKGRFYNEQIRRQADVWKVSKLAGDTKAYVEAGERMTIEGEQPSRPDKLSVAEAFNKNQIEQAQEFFAGKDYQHPPSENVPTHKFVFSNLGEVGHADDTCGECGLFRRHPVHAQVEKLVQNYQGVRRLVLTVGLPRSGKSQWSRATGFPVVSPDAIRLALHNRAFEQFAEPFVWAQARLMVRALFLAGHETVILDACNVSRARRDEWRGSEWETFCQVFEAAREECMKRALGAERFLGASEETARLLDTIDRMAASFEPLGEDEARYKAAELNTSNLGSGFDIRRYADEMVTDLKMEMEENPRLPPDLPCALADDVKPGKKDGQS